ncbi:MAG: transposase, partial [Verrucomicrobiales bacterium]
YYPTAIIQRCLVHKARNLQSYLSKRRHVELARLLKRLRRAEGKDAAKEAYDELYGFLEEHNAAALEILKEGGKTITALQDIGVPATLHWSLLSTNIIENSKLNIRRRMSKVNRWRAETKMADRYLLPRLIR